LSDFDDYVAEFDAYSEAQRQLYPEMYEDDGTGRLVRRRGIGDGGHHEVGARLRDMDFDGIASEVVFHGSQNDEPVPLPHWGSEQSVLVQEFAAGQSGVGGSGASYLQRVLADQCSVDPVRHVGLAQIPIWDVEASVAELQWAAQAGLRGVNFPTAQPWLPEFNKPVWEPFWSAAADLDLPLTTHIGPARMPTTPGRWAGGGVVRVGHHVGHAGDPVDDAGGAFERNPNLKLVITEVPGMWWPQYMTQLDSTYGPRSTPRPVRTRAWRLLRQAAQ